MFSPMPNQSPTARFNVGGSSRLLREVRIASRMLSEAGLRRTIAHLRTTALVRLDRMLCDRSLDAKLPRPLHGVLPLGAEFCTVADNEISAAVAHGPIPALTFRWALRGLAVDPRDFHFVDIGSGRGGGVLRAAALPFKSVTGIEFARCYHEDALENLKWAHENRRVKALRVELQYRSALDAELPDGACLLLLYSPFEEAVMRAFLDRIDHLLRERPRRVIAIYINPVARRAFSRPGVVAIRFASRERALIALFAPDDVRAYAWNPAAISTDSPQ